MGVTINVQLLNLCFLEHQIFSVLLLLSMQSFNDLKEEPTVNFRGEHGQWLLAVPNVVKMLPLTDRVLCFIMLIFSNDPEQYIGYYIKPSNQQPFKMTYVMGNLWSLRNSCAVCLYLCLSWSLI